MGRKLSDMSLEELWQLFPIFLTEHKSCWKDWYDEEAAELVKIFPGGSIKRISHIGSTAVENICAKPIVDILIEAACEYDLQELKIILLNSGWLCMSEEKGRISFNKGYTENGFAEKVFHLHLRYSGDNGELYFRDYLIEHKDTAKKYEKLKLELWGKYEYDRDGYTNSKTDFVVKYTEIAKQKYKNKYQ